MNDLISRARKRYLTDNPVRVKAVPTVDHISGKPLGHISIPNMDDMGIVGCKLGMEYLAICHDEDAVEEWIHTAMGIAKGPELAAVLFANVFRGVNVVIGNIIDNKGLRDQMQKLALDAWQRDFSDGAA